MRHSEEKFSLLLVDDELPMIRLLQETFSAVDYQLYTARSGADALKLLHSFKIDAALIDVVMPQMDGVTLLKKILEIDPSIKPIMLTGFGGVEAAVASIKLGAVDFLKKPFLQEELLAKIKQIHQNWELGLENKRLWQRLQDDYAFSFPELVGNATPILELKELIARFAAADSTVLIEGETGTGKELVARALHHHSPRSRRQFVPVDCGAISATVIENELFGHVRGAFTGADTSTLGLIRSADGGTLFLDEIGELPLEIQVKLLRVLQELEVRPVGSNRTYTVDVRVLAATNSDMKEKVQAGAFREDLFYRLNVLTLKVPPLRDRRDDIPLLIKYFLKRFETEVSPVREISREALACLENYDWPGNIRELKNIVRRSVAIGGGSVIVPDDLPQELLPRLERAPHQSDLPSEDSLQAFEIAAIKRALAKSSNNRPEAARLLGIGQATLYRKIKKYGIGR